MLTIDSTNRITMINGDTAYINVTVDNYTFVDGDRVTITVAETPAYRVASICKTITKGDSDTTNGYFNEDGSCTFIFQPGDTALLAAGSYVFDVQLNLVDGRVDTIIGPSTLTIIQGITKLK